MEVDHEVTVLDEEEEEEEDSNLQIDQDATEVVEEDHNEPASLKKTTDIIQENAPDNQDETMAEITQTKTKNKTTELDKFKRRLIRLLARLTLNDDTPTDEVWDDLKKQTGCNCKWLWNRMRALTLKKLKRLFTAEDIVGNITQIAQLSVTDWLLFDLVLVHEKIDVIGQDITEENKESPKILEDLFHIVVLHDIERLEGDELTRAWFEATKLYNGRTRQCSPMLMQRRWYQLKETVREKFYRFWFSYRGDQRLLPAANEYKPTDLEMKIVKQYKYIATQPFQTWEKLIELKKVALPEDFERLQLAKRKIFRSENEPDLEVIEPHVETIDLGQESDTEQSRGDGKKNENEATYDEKQQASRVSTNLKIVKTEEIDEISDEDDVHILESTDIPTETNKTLDMENDVTDNSATNNIKVQRSSEVINKDHVVEETSTLQLLSDVVIEKEIETPCEQGLDRLIEFEPQDGFVSCQDDIEMVMPTIVASKSIANTSNEIVMPKITNVTSEAIITTRPPIGDTVNTEIDGILESIAANITTNQLLNVPVSSDRMLSTPDTLEPTDSLVKNIEEELYSKSKKTAVKELDSLNLASCDVNIFDGIELQDDGIAYVEDDDNMRETKYVGEIKNEVTDDIEYDNQQTIDLKLLLTPVVYIEKLDDMDAFRFHEYHVIKEKHFIENPDSESEQVDKNSVKMQDICEERQTLPVSSVLSDIASDYYSEDDCNPDAISCSSWLLKKPRNLTYNPIQLCKNPDFNTRLKRLTAGFFSSELNRYLLKDCKPLTIDLHKAFENKLVDNTLYLKGAEFIENKSPVIENTVEKTVASSSLPIQSLIDNVVNDNYMQGPMSPSHSTSEKQILPPALSLNSHPGERNKVINLPDIAQVRVNEKLLIAEVAPIQVSNIAKPPVNIVSDKQNFQNISQNKEVSEKKTSDIINKCFPLPISSTCLSSENKTIVQSTDIVNKKNTSISANVLNHCISASPDISVNDVKKINDTSKAILSLNDNRYNTITRKTKSQISLNNGGSSTKGSFLNRLNKKDTKGLRDPKKYGRPNRVEVSWNPTPKKMCVPEDRLLASDTVDKILSVCRGEVIEWPKNKQWMKRVKKKRGRREKLTVANNKICQLKTQNDIAESSNDNEVSFVSNETPAENEIKRSLLNTNSMETQTNTPKRKGRPKLVKHSKSLNKNNKRNLGFCCWARERIENLETKATCQPHRCPRPLCTCCCRQHLVQKMLESKMQSVNSPPETEMSMLVNESEETDSANSMLVKIKISSALSKYTQNVTWKVSTGTNTDYDKDFESSYAANLATFNSNTNILNDENSLVTNLKESFSPIENHVYCQTQTSVNIMSPIKKTINDIIVDIQKSNLSEKPVRIAPKQLVSQPDSDPLNVNVSNVLLQERGNKLDKILFLTNDKMKHVYSRNPICLGKNKILLCTFEKKIKNPLCISQQIPSVMQPQITLPDGVRIVLMPNKELALSIDPGVELDSTQLTYLPTVMASIQQQLNTTDKILTYNVYEPKEKEDSHDQTNISQGNDNGNDSEIDVHSKKIKKNETSDDITSSPEQLINTDNNIIVNADKSKEKTNRALHNDIAKETDLNDDSSLNKKTILSDLMEMSGISAEDTHITNTESPPKRSIEFAKTDVPGQELNTKFANHANSDVLENPIFENPIVQTVLSRCPELSIVFSYEELKYATDNRAQFFKMDIETGVIVPINLLVKKQIKAKPLSKTVIDLTDDPEEYQVPSRKTDIDEQNYDAIPIKGKRKEKSVIPVKLFSAVHPSILRGGKSLLVKSLESIKNKKVLRIVQLNRRRKQSIQCLTSIDLDSDAEESSSNNTIFDKTKLDNDSDSDDEPLALKAKRKKGFTQTTTKENCELNTIDINDVPECIHEPIVEKTPILNVNPEQISGVESTPQIKPVHFEPLNFVDNASDEDCILGV